VYIHFDTAIYTMDGEIGGNTLHNKTRYLNNLQGERTTHTVTKYQQT